MIIFLKKIFGVANASCKRSDVFKFRARLVSQRVFNSNIQRNDSFQKRSEENGAENRIGFFPTNSILIRLATARTPRWNMLLKAKCIRKILLLI